MSILAPLSTATLPTPLEGIPWGLRMVIMIVVVAAGLVGIVAMLRGMRRNAELRALPEASAGPQSDAEADLQRQLAELDTLHRSGAISDEELQVRMRQLLGRDGGPTQA